MVSQGRRPASNAAFMRKRATRPLPSGKGVDPDEPQMRQDSAKKSVRPLDGIQLVEEHGDHPRDLLVTRRNEERLPDEDRPRTPSPHFLGLHDPRFDRRRGEVRVQIERELSGEADDCISLLHAGEQIVEGHAIAEDRESGPDVLDGPLPGALPRRAGG